jgi:hypothetical protein
MQAAGEVLVPVQQEEQLVRVEVGLVKVLV